MADCYWHRRLQSLGCLLFLVLASQVELAAGFVGSGIYEAPSQKLSVAASHSFEADENDHNPSRRESNPQESLCRPVSSLVDESRRDVRGEWGVSNDCTREFPQSIESVADQAFEAVAGTLYSQSALDPNIPKNAASKGVFDYRPTRGPRDAGRMGIEIDGAQHLYRNVHNVSPERAIRHVSLILAAKLSSGKSWGPYERDIKNDGVHRENSDKLPACRPVAVYFNTVKQALAASQELQLLKRAELEDKDIGSSKKHDIATTYDMITIQCLGDEIPISMRLDRSERRRYRGLSNGHVNATRGMIMVVQPTDYNDEYRPPGPAIGALGQFQRLAAQAAIEELPSIAVSPRFLSADSPWDGGFDQSGYQQSATYGGVEPPKGPSPWLMRDFSPPVYCWVGNAVRLAPPRFSPSDCSDEDRGWGCWFSRVGLTQSVMDRGHSWHIYAAKVCSNGRKTLLTGYEYLASTRSASGRPTRDLIRRLISDHF